MDLDSSFRTRPGDRSPARPGHFRVRQIALANLFGVELSESLCRPRGRPGASESPPAQRCLEGGFDLRWPLNPGVRLPLSGAPSGGGGALVSSMVLGPAADASNIRPVTSAPSPPSRCFRSPTAGSRGSFHRRVQRAPEVCCNFVRRCSFLGFVPPPRSLPGPPLPLRSRRSSARVDHRSLGVHPGPGLHDARAHEDCSSGRERWPEAVCSKVEVVFRRGLKPADPYLRGGLFTSKSDCHDSEGRRVVP